ncbi:MAG: hypothetical protein E4H03_14145, partial [Myxococcales bacterium]
MWALLELPGIGRHPRRSSRDLQPLSGGRGGVVSNPAAVLFIAAIVALDQLTKWLVSASMTVGQSIDIVPDFFALTYVRNPGAAFG